MNCSDEYAAHFKGEAAARKYEELYSAQTRDHHIWELQKPHLARLLSRIQQERGGIRALDFACGTGRVLTFLETFATRVDGVDVSEAMADMAKARARHAHIFVADITVDTTALAVDYDVATAFRFFLNVPDDLRVRALVALHDRLVARNGYLIANNHGQLWSLRHLALKSSRGRSGFANELSDRHFRALLVKAGFKPLTRSGFGLFPDVVDRSRAAWFSRRLDRWAAASTLFTPVSIDTLHVAQAY